MKQEHKPIADAIIKFFKETKEGTQARQADMFTVVRPQFPTIDSAALIYALEILVHKGFLLKEIPRVPGSVHVEPPIYYLSTKGWAYENYDKVIEEEKRQKQLEDALLKNSVTNNKMSPIWAGLAAGFAFLALILAVVGYFKKTESLSPSLQKLETILQQQMQRLDSTYIYLKEINSSIRLLTDSLTNK